MVLWLMMYMCSVLFNNYLGASQEMPKAGYNTTTKLDLMKATTN